MSFSVIECYLSCVLLLLLLLLLADLYSHVLILQKTLYLQENAL